MALSLTELEELPPQARVLRCRELSGETFRRAVETANPRDRAQLIDLAWGWRSLAKETEETLRKLHGGNWPPGSGADR